MIIHIDYEFKLEDKIYEARGKDIGDTIDSIDSFTEEENKKSAICDALNITIDELEQTDFYKKAIFNYCEIYF